MAIYEPSGRAAEYSHLAINIYTGCSHGCKYCYAPAATRTGPADFNKPKARKDLIKKLDKALPEYAGTDKRCLLCFTCDPYQEIDRELSHTRAVIELLRFYEIPFQILTKGGLNAKRDFDLYRNGDAFATTLTFLDPVKSRKWEPAAALPDERIEAIKLAKSKGIETWVSLEPVIETAESLAIIERTYGFVDHFKIGKLNHRKSDIDAYGWLCFGTAAVRLCEKYRKSYYVKNDLAAFMTGVEFISTDTRVKNIERQIERATCDMKAQQTKNKYHCKKCGKSFEMRPTEHGDFIVKPQGPADSEKCDGAIERLVT